MDNKSKIIINQSEWPCCLGGVHLRLHEHLDRWFESRSRHECMKTVGGDLSDEVLPKCLEGFIISES